jgi:hypothetical protein
MYVQKNVTFMQVRETKCKYIFKIIITGCYSLKGPGANAALSLWTPNDIYSDFMPSLY